MDLADGVRRDGLAGKGPLVDPPLHGDMRPRLKLQVALLQIGAVVVPQRPLDVDRVGVVAFDEIRVVAVHRPDQIGQRLPDTGRKAAPEPRRRRGQLEGEVTQPGPMARTVSKDQRLHSRLAFAPVFVRYIGRFVVRFFVDHKCIFSSHLTASQVAT